MELKIKVIASSSSGNCTLIWGAPGAVLVDCGLPIRYTMSRLMDAELSIENLSGVLMTHSHGDHIKAPFIRKLLGASVPLFCHLDIEDQFIGKFGLLGRNHIRSFGRGRFSAGDFEAEAFEVDHDSDGCYGYSLFHNGRKATFATDLGAPGPHLVEKFSDSDVIVIESNHDTGMLESSPRPLWLKRRIRDTHLSNAGCASFIRKVIDASNRLPSAIILAHLSDECNTPALAEGAMRDILESLGLDIPVHASRGRGPSETVTLLS